MKVLIIGLDGATWDLIIPWAKEGYLPTFRTLMQEGVWGTLESTTPPYTIPAWLSLSTGKTPESLGVYSFMVKKGYTFRPYFMVKRREIKFWDLVSESGRKVAILNPPDVHYAYKVNGIMVSGFLNASKEKLTYPPDLIDVLNDITNGYEIDSISVDFSKAIPRPRREAVLNPTYILNVHYKHFKAFKYMFQKMKADLTFMVFTILDRIQHICWGEKEILLSCYKIVDRHIRELMQLIDEDDVLVLVSDHGFTGLKRNLYVNDFLIREGYLTLKTRKSRFFKNFREQLSRSRSIRRLLLNILNFLPQRLREEILSKSLPIRITDALVDWTKSKAFVFSGLGEIYLNVKGRDPNGIISPEEYEKVRTEILERLRKIEEPKIGDKISCNAFKVPKRNIVYDDTPDLIIEETEEFNVDPSIGHNIIIERYEQPVKGQHSKRGIFLAYGHGIKKNYKTDIKIFDIAPTILHIFALPVPIEMDGRVIKEMFDPNSSFADRDILFTSLTKEILRKKVSAVKDKLRYEKNLEV